MSPVPPLLLGLALCGLGALHTLVYSHTAWWPLAWVAMALLPAVLSRQPPLLAALMAAAYGVGWLGAGVWWLFVSMHRFGGLPAPLAALAVLALAAALSLYLALAGALWSVLVRRAARPALAGLRLRRPSLAARLAVLWLSAAWAGLWLLAELARAQWFTGFPWVASGYAFVDSPLVRWAPWLGVYGMGALAAWVAALWALAPSAGRRAGSLAWALSLVSVPLVLLLPLVGPSEFSRSAGRLSVSLLQTHVAQDEKFAAERLPQHLDALRESLLAAKGRLVVAPETAVPLLPYQLDAVSPGWWAALAQHFGASQRVALVGVPLGDESRYTNSAVAIGSDQPYRYDKHHLVPFGEFIPRGFRWFTEAMQIPLGDFARGPVDAPSLPVGGQFIGPNICYEDLFGEELAVRFLRGPDAPTVLVNISNIGWFGDTVALPQHLNLSRLRTLELERPMLRSTNTGVTAIIDHDGRVLAQLPAFTRATLEGEVEGRTGLTPYAAWAGRWGLLPLWLAGLLMAGCGLLASRRP
ncbi:MAG: apolipoprotein N-acyltransferase [Rubrivivax sp.]|nr:apolipoprotein N-acyltransferase [Rubrivivax sp.]